MNEVITILCLEDSPKDAEIIRELLIDAGYNLRIDCTAAEKEFVSLLRNHKYDIILSDFKLPGFDGFAALKWSMEICPGVPFICVSGSIGESLAVELLKKGAVDYIIKDKLERLPSAVKRALDAAKSREAQLQAERQLRIYSETQSLLLHTTDLTEIYRLVADKISELIGDGIVFTTLLDESSQTLGIVSYKGLNVPLEKLIRTLRIDPVKMVCHLKDITEDELRVYRSGKLEELDGGIYTLATRRIPKRLCKLAERMLKVEHVFTMGFIWQEVHFGGLVILAQSDLSLYKGTIELLINQAVTSINRLRAEMKLTSQNALLNALINSPEDLIIFSANKNYCYTAFNEKHREEMKKVWNADIEIGMNLLDYMSIPEFKDAAKKSIDRVLKGESISEIQHQANLNIYYEFTWNPIIQNDEVTGATIFIRDITERKKAEESLQKERILLRTVIDNIPSTVYVKDTELRKILVNKADLALIGKPEIEVLGKTDRDFFSEEAAVRFSADDQAVLDTGKPLLNREEQVDKYNGKKIWLLTSKLPLHDNEGKITGLVGIGYDITERKRAEEEIYRLNAELEQRVIERTAELSDLYNNAPCGYHLLNEDGLFVRINDTELKWLGYNREEIVGMKKFSHLLTDESARQFSMNFPVFKEQGWIKDLEFDMVRKDGSFLPVLMSGTSETDSEGNYQMNRSTITDNTERRQAEETMFESQQKLEYLNRELEDFAYSVSHDLRAPLRAIDGFTHILLEEYSPKIDMEGQRICSVISENAVKMGQLIDDLLSFSRLSRSAINYSDVDMKAMADKVFNEIAEPAKKSMIVFDLQELPPAFCDTSLLKQVWINLLSNAIKYTRKCKNPAITVGYEQSGTETTYYAKDNGVGFEQEFAGKLFGVFQRLHKSDEFEGTGVGLAIVKRIIDRHGGRVWAEGEINKGAAFYFTLPHKK